MNREIKFRFYKPSTGFMKVDSKTFVSSDLIEEEDWKVMQYTGLKDKNGVEIYEGDIVRWQCYTNEAIEDGKIGQIIWDEKELGWRIKENYIDNSPSIYKKIEVIGNIFSNPELIK